MSFVVRTTFPYTDKYFDTSDNEKQQLTDYLMHEYLQIETYTMYGSFSLQTAIEIKEALDASPLFVGTVVVNEYADEFSPDGLGRSIQITRT